MKNIYFKSEIATPKILILVLTAWLGFTFAANAQVRVPFAQRTSQFTPTKKIYNIKGDFTMMGNTNLTLQNYGNLTENGNNTMVYVDVDENNATGLGGTRTFNSSTATLGLSTENGAVPECSNIIYAGLYWTGRAANGTSTNTFNVTKGGVTKTFNKRKIQFRGPGAAGYTEFTAGTNEIYYPTNQDENMYSAYAEVTDYVRTHGVGQYTAADIALVEGNGGGTGYYGGWGLIVVYENSKMKYRDVTIFDGHAFVISGTASNQLPISGFNTVQAGPVGIKIGLMAGEGDNGISGDYFEIRRQDNQNWQRLNHSANTTGNFFNSTIQTPGARTPSLQNNTGLDISMFNLPNTNNGLITNNQTSTTFRYGSTQDTYCIFAIAMAVDAYIPEVEGNLSAVSINNTPVPSVGPYTALPGQEMEFKVQVRNRGTEPINNATLSIPIPYNTEYVNNSATRQIFFNPAPTPNSLVFNPASGSNGSLVWNIGTLPVPATPDTVLGELVFKVTVTTDCELLKNANCQNIVAVNGSFTGTGAITGITFNGKDLIQGYTQDGNCQGTAIVAPLLVNVNATEYVNANCQSTPPITAFTFCSMGEAIPITEVSGSFPNGSTFYNQYPVGPNAIQYTINNPFPATVGTTTYYAVPPGALQGCYFQFTITVTTMTSTPTVDSPLDYCLNSAAQPLTATPSGPGLTLYYFTSLNGQPQVSITPSTAAVGSTTYYVAEAASPTCIGPKVPIVVNVYPSAQIMAPAAYELNACGPSAITEFPYSTTPAVITLAQFQQMGGTISNADGLGSYTLTYSDIRTGNCPVTVTRTFTLNSSCGTATATQIITIRDTTPPTISGLPATPGTMECSATPAWVTPSVSDNCEGLVDLAYADTTVQGNCANSYTITRTWTATDLCGNVATATQVFTVSDTQGPVISALPAPSTINCTETPSFATPTATDACGGTVTLTSQDQQTAGSCPNAYTIVRTWTATDVCGNTATASQSISVQDVTAPVITTQAQDLAIQCSTGNQDTLNQWLASNGGAVANDACGAVTWTNDFKGIGNDCSAAVTVVFTATDACGNTATTSATFSLKDDVAPVAPSAPANVNVQCASQVPANISLTATDNCAGNITVQGVDVTTPGACAGSFTIVRTWTFVDACANTSSVSQTITVNDTIAPVAPAAPATVLVSCASEVPANQTLTATDNCGDIITAEGVDVINAGSCPNTFKIVRTWTFTDSCGNSSSVSQTINVNDSVAPVAPAAPANVSVQCTADVPANVTLTAQDNCNGAITAQGVDVTTPGNCPNSFTIVRTWTFTDACGNTSSVSQTINVNDNIAPVAPAAPANVTAACSSEVPANVTLTALDNCSGEITAQGVDVTTPGNCPNAFVIVRTWTFTDACGNTSSVSQTINVNDNVAPVAPSAPANVTAACTAEVPANVTLTAQDNCSGAITAQGVDVTTPGACAGSFTIVRTWTFVDACGNTSSVSQTISVNDNIAPVISQLPTATTIDCPATPSFATPTATDNCGGEVTLTFEDVTAQGACAATYSVTRTWTATDACGNTAVASQTINVQDITAPAITAEAQNLTIQCGANQNALNDWLANNGGATATDSCSAVTWSNNYNGIGNDCSAAITVVFTATDACGTASTTSATFMVSDTTAPVAPAAPANVSVQCAADVPANVSLTATDNCAGDISVQGVDVTTPGACAGSYTIIRTWTFTDACANTTSVSQTISVNDTAAPVAPAAPAGVTAQCSSEVPANITLTALDNCGDAITAQGVDVTTPGECAGSFTIVRTWTFTDACGNSSSVSQNISVNDTTAPVAPAAPADVTAACASEVPANVTLTATDNCGGEITAQGVDVTTPGECANAFVIVRTWTFADACGNTSSVSQTININDNVAPVIASLPAASTIDCPATPVFAQATATDNCAGDVTLTFEDATTQGQCAGSYSITRTWTATDACGNTATASQTVNVQDVTAPTITAQAQNLAIQCGAGNENALNDWLASNGGATATDACSDVTWANNYDGIGNDCTSAVTVIFTATDACGNTATTSATFTVSDTTAPVAPEAPAAVAVQCAADVPANITLTATDNCAGDVSVQGVDVTTPGACAGSYTIVRTWTFVDACANSVSVSQTITVNDTIAPIVPEAPATANVSCASEVPANVTLTAQDACQGAIEAQGVDVVTEGSCPNSFTVVRTWTFTDSCGNSSSVSQTINVNDTIAPVAPEAPANVTAQCTADVPANVTLTATDNCGDEITAQGVDVTTQGECAGSFTIVRTWTFTDACGNASSVSQTIAVNDTTAPTAAEAPADVTATCAGEIPANVTLTATDNCGEIITAQGVDVTTPGECANSFTIVRTWTFTDACGNTSSVSQNINVNDNVAPVIAQLPAASTIECPATAEFAQATATDNCAGDVTLTFEDVNTAGACAGSYSITRTWTATDACGNTATATQTINVQDTTAPTITAEAQNLAIQCGNATENLLEHWLATHGGATATDACSEVTWTNNYDGIGNDCSAAVTVIFTATDACGNASTTSATFTISDTVAPVAPEAPAAVTVACAADVPANISLVATDNCLGEISVQGVDVTTPGACAGTYTIVRTWTFTDACANTTSISQTINVVDDVAPTAPTAPADVTIQCGDELPANATLTAVDNCGTEISAQGVDVTTQGECAGTSTIVRTWTFTDACGNSSSVSQTINVIDTTAPVAPAAPADVTAQCASEVPAAVTLTANDACSGETAGVMTEVNTPGACPNAFTLVRTWTFTDACGNVSTVTQTINVNDTTAPVAAEAPADVTASCGGEVPANVTLTATDNCGGEIAAQGVDVTAQGACANSYTIVRTWTFTDACGNASSVSQNISVGDTTAPVLPDNVPADVTVSCAADVPSAITLTATDNCDSTPITAQAVDAVVAGSCANSFVITRTWTFVDACGNTAVATQVITVNDTTAPTFDQSAPATVTVECTEIPAAATLTATDNCGQTAVAVTMTETTTPGSCAGTYTLVRTWSATDACGNEATVSQSINVVDTTAPAFVEALPEAAITAECGAVPAPSVLTALDACNNTPVQVVYAESSVATSCPVVEVITRTWTATDSCGNVVMHTQTVNVQDTTAPTLNETLEPVVNVNCDAVPTVPVLTFADSCTEVQEPVFTQTTSDVIEGNYTITWTWVVTDECGNEATFTQVVNVTVNDSLITVENEQCNEDVSASIDLVTILPAGTPAGGTWVNVDNVGGLNGSVFQPNGIPNGIYTVDYVINDAVCPRTVRIRLNVNEEFCEVDPACTVTVNNAFSPNNDGINEFFNINGFETTECVVSNSVEIYNRWGVLVFEMKNYNNNDRAFRGVSEGRVTLKQDDELPTGTYFYIITYKKADGTSGKQDGYLYLSR